jgi:hypothetical protein
MFTEEELLRYVELAEKSMETREVAPLVVIEKMKRVCELIYENYHLFWETEVLPENEVPSVTDFRAWGARYVRSIFEAKHQNEWYQPIETRNGTAVKVSDIRNYLDNWRLSMNGDDKPWTLDDQLDVVWPKEEDGHEWWCEICTADLLVTDLFRAINNEILDMIDEAYVGRFIGKEEWDAALNENVNILFFYDMAPRIKNNLGEAPVLDVPTFQLQYLLKQPWFAKNRSDEKYDTNWTDAFVEALMASEYGEGIARDWAVQGLREKKTQIRGYVVGMLKDAGVLKGSYRTIAAEVGIVVNVENKKDPYRTFADYMGRGKKQPYAQWVKGYVWENS